MDTRNAAAAADSTSYPRRFLPPPISSFSVTATNTGGGFTVAVVAQEEDKDDGDDGGDSGGDGNGDGDDDCGALLREGGTRTLQPSTTNVSSASASRLGLHRLRAKPSAAAASPVGWWWL